ncbi:hypothetical protein WJ63_06370 [Burkholderia pyrrocinia]|nr:hypothetical protein WJ63_06370 [Burkholderia pyrrocinia]
MPGCAAFRKLLPLFGQSTDVPDERGQFAGNSHDRDVDGLASRGQPAESSAQPYLGVPGAVDDGLGQTFETGQDFGTDADRMAVTPAASTGNFLA